MLRDVESHVLFLFRDSETDGGLECQQDQSGDHCRVHNRRPVRNGLFAEESEPTSVEQSIQMLSTEVLGICEQPNHE
ncbi:unannotated protein [freshwater metagenome]|uniref:Unannotated protein n=1 Tax=freshwater metagenome TaxID=449393 RepID=A0A6J6ZPC0_9ZZZZ